MALKSLIRFVRDWKDLSEDVFFSSSSAALAVEPQRL
jgi:hypothetical protein